MGVSIKPMPPVLGFLFGSQSRDQAVVSCKPVIPIVGASCPSRFNQTRDRGGATIKGGTACHALSDSIGTKAIITEIRSDREFAVIVFLDCPCRTER